MFSCRVRLTARLSAGTSFVTVVPEPTSIENGYRFIKIDSGMTEIVRPAMYGAQHPLILVPATPETRKTHDYVVAGHCCESGDVLTPAPENPEALQPRVLPETRNGDLVVNYVNNRPSTVTVYNTPTLSRASVNYDLGIYAQDAWTPTPRLTLNLGVRWEYTSPLVEKNDRQVNFDLVTGKAIFPPGAIPANVCPGSTTGCAEGEILFK